MKEKLILSVVLSVFLPLLSLAQEYPKLVDVRIHAAGDRSQNEDLYYYTFGLTNGLTSLGKINRFDIDISRNPWGVDFDTSGIRFENDGLIEARFRRHFSFLKGKIVPVGLLASPGNSVGFTWTGGFSNNLMAGWSADSTTIDPGQSLGGFVMVSKGMPGIRRCIVFPFFDFDSLFSRERFPTNEDLPNTDSIQAAVKFYGWTVGPIAPPMIFDGSNWTDTLVSYSTRSRSLGWITNQASVDKYVGYFAAARAQLQANNTEGARSTLQTVLQDANADSSSVLTSEAYALIRYNTEYLLSQLPNAPPPGLNVKLINSSGTNLTGGSLQYYDGTWKDATNNNDGTFNIATSLRTLSLRMTYEFGSQTKSNVTVGTDTMIFQTVNTQVKLQNSQGGLMDTGSVQYYAGAWRSFGTTASGVASKELLPVSYSFRMTYASGSNDKQQDIGPNPVVVFQTVNASAQLKNSQGNLMDQGSVQYYAGSWRNFGATTNGVATKELLPSTYSFRMTYAYGSKDLQQNIGTNPVIVFQTVNAIVQLKNSLGASIDQGAVQYYAGAWRSFGTTSGGSVSKELLPVSYSFRMTIDGISNDKAQDPSTNSTLSFSTVLCTVSVKTSQNQPVNNALISYYSGAWRQIGPTVNGQVTKELLPANLTFRMTLGTVSQDKVQNIGTNGLVEFSVQ